MGWYQFVSNSTVDPARGFQSWRLRSCMMGGEEEQRYIQEIEDITFLKLDY
jgi:hypothetical protein